jgi:tetratricopeptide (TPR) repeat protein
LAPTAPDGYYALAAVRGSQRRWADAIAAADAGLRIQPDFEELLAIRVVALNQAGRHWEAAAASKAGLRDSPTNPALLLGHGLTLLYQNRASEAVDTYVEVLRVDPTNAAARAGLVEALRARNPIFGSLLAMSLAFARQGSKGIFVLFIGWFAFQSVVRAMYQDPGLEQVAFAVSCVYALFVWFLFAAPALFTLLLYLDPLGREALTSEYKREANITGALVLVGALAGVGALMTSLPTPLVYLMVVSLGLVIPVSNVFAVDRRVFRSILWAYALATAAVGSAAVVAATAAVQAGDSAQRAQAADLFFYALGLIVVSTWIGAVVNRG